MKDFIGRIEMFVGFLSLGLAAFLLRLETRRRGQTGGSEQALGPLSIMTAGALTLVASYQQRENTIPNPR